MIRLPKAAQLLVWARNLIMDYALTNSDARTVFQCIDTLESGKAGRSQRRMIQSMLKNVEGRSRRISQT